ncbi:MAG: hypothetical protein ACI9E4_001056 [Pseudohongiellaceae bacterium]|jgi:hypothetical protein
MPAGNSARSNVASKIAASNFKLGLVLIGFGWSAIALAAEPSTFARLSDPLLEGLRQTLLNQGVLVSQNLNARDTAGPRPDQPRLGGFADLPIGSFPGTDELLNWEADFQAQQIAALAIIVCADCSNDSGEQSFISNWLQRPASQRVLLSYYREELAWAELVAAVALNAGFLVKHLQDDNVSIAGEFYATVGRRLGLDTRGARASKSDVPEIKFLGQRVRRNSDSIFRVSDRQRGLGVANNEPANFLNESLGDEFTQSTIREVIVPGGVALGATAKVAFEISALEFDGQGLLVVDQQNKRWRLPTQDVSVTKSLFDFVQRSTQLRSDAVVDIDGKGAVRISSSVRDTDVGYEIMQADTQPFKFVRNLNVSKSVVIDTFVRWKTLNSADLSFSAEYEVRFLSADNMRIAQTKAALVYAYDSIERASRYTKAWGSDASRLNESLDTAGLGNSLNKVAEYSGWVALLRNIEETDISFLKGRYQFMKIDSSGRSTPARY